MAGAGKGLAVPADVAKQLAELSTEEKHKLVQSSLQALHAQAAAAKLATLPLPVRNRVKAMKKLHVR
jgi:hypothetical protein